MTEVSLCDFHRKRSRKRFNFRKRFRKHGYLPVNQSLNNADFSRLMMIFSDVFNWR